jgi:hypothetical protein
MKRTLWIGLTAAVVCALLYPRGADAQDQRRLARMVLPVLKIDHGARMAGMGGAFVAVSDNIDAIFSNPAGLTHIERGAFTLGYTRWLMGDPILTGGMAYNTAYGVLGINVVTFSPHEFEETTIFQPTGTGRYPDMGDLSLGVVYARKLTDKLSVGSMFRWTQQTLDTDRLTAFDVGVSTFFYTGFRSLRLGMTFENMGKDVKVIDDVRKMPVSFSTAAAMEIVGAVGDPTYITATFENTYATDFADPQYRFGGELWLQNNFALRAGYKANFDEESWTVGAGLKFSMPNGRVVQADVAYSDFGAYLDAPLRFTLSGAF